MPGEIATDFILGSQEGRLSPRPERHNLLTVVLFIRHESFQLRHLSRNLAACYIHFSPFACKSRDVLDSDVMWQMISAQQSAVR